MGCGRRQGKWPDGECNSSFCRDWPLFSTRAEETVSLRSVGRFGPAGIGIGLHQPAFVMKVKNVEKGSPAEATGKLKPGQIIESVNGQKLKDNDPRIRLGGFRATNPKAIPALCMW
jgi:membrane-associated protease RseP (regulator of RpoE activity)